MVNAADSHGDANDGAYIRLAVLRVKTKGSEPDKLIGIDQITTSKTSSFLQIAYNLPGLKAEDKFLQ